jgi:hypothetical protein
VSPSADSTFAASVVSPSWPEGPKVRPLDYGSLATAADVHAELEKTVGELGRWLEVVHEGLSMALTK